MTDRDTLLASMTDEVGRLVLAHNYDQNLALANSVYQAPSMAGVHEDWMERLADQGLLDRDIEFLPSTDVMEARRTSHKGLTAPELAVLLAYTKIVLEDEILETDLPDDPYLLDRLISYFPSGAAGALCRPDARAPAAPRDHHHGRRQPVRQPVRHHLLPPAVRPRPVRPRPT